MFFFFNLSVIFYTHVKYNPTNDNSVHEAFFSVLVLVVVVLLLPSVSRSDITVPVAWA